jgi:capsular exopolysaccharide synthesis family protein
MEQQFSFTKQGRTLWRFKWMIILVALVAGVTSLLATGSTPPLYTATVTMAIESNPNLTALPAGSEPFASGLTSQMEIIKSHDVLERAIITLEPGMADNPQQLEFAIADLKSNLTVRSFGETNLVGLNVVATDPMVAQQQANAVAKAYIDQVLFATQQAVETVLANTTERMHQLITRDLDLTNNPQLTRLTAQFNTALPALQAVRDQLNQLAESTGVPATEDSGTILTANQLSLIIQHTNDILAEADALTGLAGNFQPVAGVSDFTARSASIAVLESRLRALSTKMGILSSEIGGTASVEIDPQAQAELLAADEQLAIALTTGSVFLDQVVSLYGIQTQYQQSSSASPSNPTQTALHAESDRTALRRMNEHAGLMANSLETAYNQLQRILPRAGTLTQWRLEALAKRTSSVIIMVQDIAQQLQPVASTGQVLLAQPDVASLEVRGQMVSLTMATLAAELQAAQTSGAPPEVTTSLISIEDMVNEAGVAVGNLGNDITMLAEQESSSLSYTALDQLRLDLQYSLISLEDNASSRVVDSFVTANISDIFTKYKSTILAAIAGLFVGSLVAFTLQYFDRTARDVSQVSGFLGLPPLAQIARISPEKNPGGPLSVLTEQMYQCLEAFRMLRTNLAIDSTRGLALLVTSASEREGKTTVAANLARVIALQGRRVLLIDGNLRQPGLAEAFDLNVGEGMAEYLKGTQDPWDYIAQADGVNIITSGTASVTSAEMLSSPRMKTLLESAKEMFDIVILDSAPVMGCADTRILARDVDIVMLVVKADSSKLDLVKASKEALEAMGARVTGFVLNKADDRECRYLPPPRIADKTTKDADVEVPANIA